MAGAVRARCRDVDVEVWDGVLDRLNARRFAKRVRTLKREGRALAFGFQVYSSTLPEVYRLVQVVRATHPAATVVLGGPHPSCAPGHALRVIPGVDYEFCGEAELGLPVLVDFLAGRSTTPLSSVPGLVYRDLATGRLVRNPPKFVEDLDELDPAYDLLHLERYPVAPHGSYCRQFPVAPIVVTRGCPNNCGFCAATAVSGAKVRHHSVAWVVDTLRELVRRYGVREFHVEDDNFTRHREFVAEFCRALLASGLDLTWTAANGVRLDSLDDELVDLMVKSGMHTISVGIESGSDEVRASMGKRLTTATVLEKLRLLKRHDVDLVGFFVLGYPTDTPETIEQTIRFACRLPLVRANFAAFQPFPGTRARAELAERGLLRGVRWENLRLHAVSWAPPGMTLAQLDRLRKKALWRFYARPRVLWGLVRRVRAPFQLFMILKRAYNLLFRRR